jgi:hypothetical protein
LNITFTGREEHKSESKYEYNLDLSPKHESTKPKAPSAPAWKASKVNRFDNDKPNYEASDETLILHTTKADAITKKKTQIGVSMAKQLGREDITKKDIDEGNILQLFADQSTAGNKRFCY